MAFAQSVNPVWSKALCDAILAALTAPTAAGFLNAPKVHLFVNNITFGRNNVLTDLTEATFPGYVAQVMGALVGPVTLASGNEAKYVDSDFICNAVTTPSQLAYGYYVTDTASAILYAGESFSAPITIVNPGDFVSLELIWPEPRIHAAT